MSAAEVRQAIADAANTVPGVAVSPYFVQTTRPGSGMVRRDRTEYPNRFGGVVYWQVAVLLSQDVAIAEKWQDENLPALVEALSAELIVDSTTPQMLGTDNGSIPAILIQGHRSEND